MFVCLFVTEAVETIGLPLLAGTKLSFYLNLHKAEHGVETGSVVDMRFLHSRTDYVRKI
jgi:hypothetical protein